MKINNGNLSICLLFKMINKSFANSFVKITRHPSILIEKLQNDHKRNIKIIIMSLNRYKIKLPKDIWNCIMDILIPISNIDSIMFIDQMMHNNQIHVTPFDDVQKIFRL